MTPGDGPARVRRLWPGRDAAAVRDLFERAADYVVFETGWPPGDDAVAGFFADRPPGTGARDAFKYGLALPDGRLGGVADLCFGFPAPGDAYIGLMLIDQGLRGRGLGAAMLGALAERARRRGAPRLLLAVLDGNDRGRAFWERHGFRVVLTLPPARIGARMHVRHRMERPLGAPG